MGKYDALIDNYSDDYYKAIAHGQLLEEWDNTEKVIAYLDKYYIPREEYENVWKPKQETIFMNIKKFLPEMMFQPGYIIHPAEGGCLFMEEDFLLFQKGLQNLGEKQFVVIEQESWLRPQYEERLNLKFPVSISWHDMLTGGVYISDTLCNDPYMQFFLFGENTGWGMYVDNDYDLYPIILLGTNAECEEAFTDYYNLPFPRKENYIYGGIPKIYFEKGQLKI